MPDIKTRDVVSGTIKAVDRSALAGQRMKDAYVQAKDKAEHSVYSSESTSEEYATNQMTDGVSTVVREAVHQVDVQGHRIIQGAQRKFTQRQENPQPQQSPPQSTSGSPQSSPNTPASISPQQVQNSLGTEDIHHAQQPYRVSPDGAASSGMGGHSEVGSGTSIPKQEAVHQQQIASAKAELRAKRASQQTVSTVPKAPGEGKVFHSHQVPTTKATATRQTVKSVENITIKTSQRTIKTASSTVKTVEHMGGTAIKSTQAAAETAQKTAVIAATPFTIAQQEHLYQLSRILLTELINRSYSQEYIYLVVKDIFYNKHRQINDVDAALEQFWSHFDFEEKAYTVILPLKLSALKKHLSHFQNILVKDNDGKLFGNSCKWIIELTVNAMDPYIAHSDAKSLISFLFHCFSIITTEVNLSVQIRRL